MGDRSAICPRCQSANLAEGDACRDCGMLLTVSACPRCGARVDLARQPRCPGCGRRLRPILVAPDLEEPPSRDELLEGKFRFLEVGPGGARLEVERSWLGRVLEAPSRPLESALEQVVPVEDTLRFRGESYCLFRTPPDEEPEALREFWAGQGVGQRAALLRDLIGVAERAFQAGLELAPEGKVYLEEPGLVLFPWRLRDGKQEPAQAVGRLLRELRAALEEEELLACSEAPADFSELQKLVEDHERRLAGESPWWCAGGTDAGCVREANEDCFRILDPAAGRGLLVVCDGMGGHRLGEVASRLVADCLVDAFRESSGAPEGPWEALLEEAVWRANDRVYKANQELELRDLKTRMGTTVVAVVVDGAEAHCVHVGDSRLYHFRGGRLELLSQDHNIAHRDVRMGLAESLEEALRLPHGRTLTQALGPRERRFVHPEVQTLALVGEGMLCLCSDGLTDMVPEDRIEAVLAAHQEAPGRAVRELLERAREAGGEDNITVVVARYRLPGRPEPPPGAPPRRRRLRSPEELEEGRSSGPPRGS